MLRDKSVRVHEIGIEVFSPFTPMLGERAAPDQVRPIVATTIEITTTIEIIISIVVENKFQT